MDAQVSLPPADQSSKNDKEPSSKIDEPELGEEEEQFFDAGENATRNSSDVTPSDSNFSVANEDLPTDGSDHSEQNAPAVSARSKRNFEPILDDLDDISTDEHSSMYGSNSPRTNEALLDDHKDDSDESKPALSCESERNEDVISHAPSDDAVHQNSTEDMADKSCEDVLPSHEDNSVNDNSSKSSMEVMEDESDSPPSARDSPIQKVPNSDAAPNENSSVDVVEANVENSTDNDSEMMSKQNACLDSVSTEKDEKVPEASEILTMDDSDVDESLQENLDVAIKVVEESQSSPVHTSTAEELETCAKTDDCSNNDDLPKDATSESESILQEFRDDVAKINGYSSELLDSRLCPCQVVLFRIDFDEYALKYLKNKTETVQSSGDHSNLDTSLSKAADSDFNSEGSPAKSSPPKRRVLTKAARKMIPSPESAKKPTSPRARNLRALPDSKSTRPRRKVRDATAQGSKYAHSDSSNSDDEAPLVGLKGRRKAVANGTKRLARTARKPSHPQRTSSRRSVPEEIDNSEKELSVDLSDQKILKCVSIPIITDLIDSLEEKSCSELIALIERNEDKLPSQISTKSKWKKSTTVARCSRRRKLSSGDTSKSAVEDDDYKTYGKMRRYEDGTSKEDDNLSSRSEAKSTSNKRSARRSAKDRNNVEDSESDEKVPLKKAKTRSRGNLSRAERSSENKNTGSDDEQVEHSPKSKLTSNKKSPRKSPKVRNQVKDSECDNESPLKKEKSSRGNDGDDKEAEDSPKGKSTSNRRSARKSAKNQEYVEDSKSDDDSPVKKDNASRKNSSHVADIDDEHAEDSSKAKSTSNKRLFRKSAKIQNYVEDSKSDDDSPVKKDNVSRKNSTRVIDSDDEQAEDSSKAKSTPNKRLSRKSSKIQNHVEDSKSDDNSSEKKKRTSRENSTHAESNEKNVTECHDKKADDSPTSNKRSPRKSVKVQKYVEDSDSDNEFPEKKENMDIDNSIHVERSEQTDTDSYEKADDSPRANSTSSKRSSRQSAKVPKYVEDSEPDDEFPSENDEKSKNNSTHDSDNDEKVDDFSKMKSTSNKRSSRENSKIRKCVEDFEPDDESPWEKDRTGRKNSNSDSNSDEEKAEDFPKAKSMSNRKSSRRSVKIPKYVEDSEADDESPLKKERTSRRNSAYDSSDEKAENLTKNKRSSRQSAKVPKYVEDSEPDDESPLEKERTISKNSTHNSDEDDVDEKVEDLPKMKSTSSIRSSRTNVKSQKYVEDSESDDESPLKNENTRREDSIRSVVNEKNYPDLDDESAKDSSSESDDQSSSRRKSSSSSSRTRTRA